MSDITVSFDLIKRIRLHINRTEKQAALLENRKKWLRLTAALDVLEDTACAVGYYFGTEYPSDINGKYLFTYGLIQSLFVQEDAIQSIFKSLFDKEIDFKIDYPEAYKVREMRDDVVGHPTDRYRGEKFIHLAQCSMKKDCFYYTKWDGKHGTHESIHVNVINAADEVAKCVNDILNTSVKDLDREFIEYIEKHKDQKMKEIFNHLGYAREKVLLNTDIKQLEYEKSKSMVEQCEEELIKRYGSIGAANEYQILLESIHTLYQLIDEGLQRIPSDLRPEIEKCLLENLFSKLEKLESYCEETDSYFENYGEEAIEPSDDIQVVIVEDI